MKTRILLADDHKIMRDGLCSMLAKEEGVEVIGESENGRTAVELAQALKPDVVIMDIGMPDLNGIEATRQIVADAPRVKVLALSIHADRRYVMSMLRAGASGYLLKECAFEELVHAVRAVVANRTYMSPAIADIVVDSVRHPSQDKIPADSVLTAKEREVLQLLAEGMTTKEIASQLQVSAKTVETHRQHIMNKLDVHSVAELTKYAVREGLSSLES